MRPTLRKTLVTLLAAGAIAVGLLVVAVAVLTTTPFGAKQAIRLGAQRIPGEISIGEVDGNLYSGLELGDVRYRNENVDATAESLIVEPSLSDLADGRWVLNRLQLENGRVAIAEAPVDPPTAPPATQDPPSAFELPELPQNLEVRELRIDDVEIDGLGTPIHVETLAGSVRGGSVDLDRVVIDAAGATLDAAGEATLAAERVTGALAGSVRLPAETPAVRPPSGADVSDAAGAANAGDAGNAGDADNAGDVADAGDADNAADAGNAGSADAGNARAADAGDSADSAHTIAFDTTFTFDENAGDDAWEASIDWSRLEWRRPGEPAVASPSGSLVVQPRNDGAFDVSARATVEGEPLPGPVSLTANGAVSADAVDVEHARVEIAGGEAELDGAFRFDARSGYVSVDYRGLDPSVLDARMAGELHGRIDVAVAAAPELRVAGAGQVAGNLDGRPLDGRVVASYADTALSIERAAVSLDGGQIVVEGMLSPDASDLRFAASLPRLGNWYPPVTGALTAAGFISGDNDDPRVDIELDGESLAWDGARIPPLERVALRVDGTRAAHTLRFDAESALGGLALEAEQHYADGRVSGRLIESVLEPRDAGVWRLARPAGYSASTTQLELELGTACFAGPGDASVCTAVEPETLTVLARDVPTALAEPWLPDRFVVSGTTDADIEVAFAGPLEASGTLRHEALRIGIEGEDENEAEDEDQAEADADGEVEVDADAEAEAEADADADADAEADDVVALLDLGDVAVSASLDRDSLRAELTGGSASESSSLLATTAVEGRLALSPPAADGRLEGAVSARLTELGALGTLVDGVDALSGVVDAQLAVAGTLDSPSVSGSVDASELAAGLPALGIDVTDGRLAADITDSETVPFDVELCSEGCARMTGELSLDDAADWTLTARVEGEDVLVVDLPQVRAVMTPRLAVRATPELATISGAITVPVGSIEVEDVPRSAVRPAPETVVHGRRTADAEDRLAIPLSIAVQASLGDVRFDGLGLEAQLAGTLDVEHARDGDWIVQGTTTIEEGTFSAYGQTLAIEQGLLVFTGPPDNPQLDIRATRVVDGSEVSLAVTGTAENPRSAVFSEAGVSESEAFAQLLTGRSLENIGESDPEALERAAIGLGLRRALPTLDRIGSALGLDELGVQSPGDDEGAVVAGMQIGDDVYLRYRHGLFDDFSGLELIYRITERFRLRTQTGTAQSIDLIYEVDPGGPETLAEDIEDIDVAIQDNAENPVENLGPDVDAE